MQQRKSKRANKVTGYRGVRLLRRTGLFRASLKYKRERFSLGDFHTAELAVEARNEFIRQHRAELPAKYEIQPLKQ